jgi:DNA-binding transcriptional MerR regulator
MPYKKPNIEKIFYTIGEVADMIGENQSTIRYWENQFDALKPKKNAKGNRLFTKEDVFTVKLIHHLVKERGMTLKGAQLKLRDNREATIHNYEIVHQLLEIRQQLVGIRDNMNFENQE